MKLKIYVRLVAVTIITLIFMEIALRVQQKIGPIYDLKFEHITMDGISDVVNHKPLSENTIRLSNSTMYGDLTGYEYKVYFDANGIRKNSLRSRNEDGDTEVSILFMGDSFIEGYDDSNTVPQHVWIYLKKKGMAATIHNAGCASYSPAIFIPQSKQLIPELNPDFVVVDIDETDLGDDFIRYRNLIVRDDNGKNIAVRTSPLLYENNNGFIKIKKQPIFIIRLFQTIYHTKIRMLAYIKKYRVDNRHVLSFSREKSKNANDKYHTEIEFFRNNVFELAETLIALMGDRHRILFLYHPHLQHLQPDSNGQCWNNFVSAAVKEAAENYNIAFYDASDDLRTVFKGNPQDFYWKGGNIHLNFTGLKIYGNLVAKRLLSLIKSIE